MMIQLIFEPGLQLLKNISVIIEGLQRAFLKKIHHESLPASKKKALKIRNEF